MKRTLCLLLAALLDQAVSTGAGIQFEAVMGATCLWFIASEGLSILENVAMMGVPGACCRSCGGKGGSGRPR